ncbi:WD40/YVTN/BNR-like repeat-containing protein [Planctomycetaceae bacterium SH139]
MSLDKYLLRTRDLGQTWEEISPDLTRNQDHRQGKGGGPLTVEAVGAESYGTISYVAESPHEPGVFWTGSDDGLVQLTRDAGHNWSNVTPQDLDECLINAIEISPHDKATAYIATTRYKFNDKRPGLYKTTDYGQSWTAISSGIPEGAFTRVVREEPRQQGLLFAGTEMGLYLSRDGGASWQPFQLNLPVTPILDLMIRHDDLIVATSGRSIWILDDLELIRQREYLQDDANADMHLFEPAADFLSNHSSHLDKTDLKFDGTDLLHGVNPANGVVIYYELPELPEGAHVELEIRDADGLLVNRFSSEKDESFQKYAGGPPVPRLLTGELGLIRFVWDMRHASMPGVPEVYIEGSYRGHRGEKGSGAYLAVWGEKGSGAYLAVWGNLRGRPFFLNVDSKPYFRAVDSTHPMSP